MGSNYFYDSRFVESRSKKNLRSFAPPFCLTLYKYMGKYGRSSLDNQRLRQMVHGLDSPVYISVLRVQFILYILIEFCRRAHVSFNTLRVKDARADVNVSLINYRVHKHHGPLVKYVIQHFNMWIYFQTLFININSLSLINNRLKQSQGYLNKFDRSMCLFLLSQMNYRDCLNILRSHK